MVKVWNARDPARPVDAVYVGRGSRYGNPFAIGKDGTRGTVLRKYWLWLQAQTEVVAWVKAELKDRDLYCWCAPKSCHAHILRAVAAGREALISASLERNDQWWR